MEVVLIAGGLLLLIGFICGYGVRALISHLRWAKARRRHFDDEVLKDDASNTHAATTRSSANH